MDEKWILIPFFQIRRKTETGFNMGDEKLDQYEAKRQPEYPDERDSSSRFYFLFMGQRGAQAVGTRVRNAIEGRRD